MEPTRSSTYAADAEAVEARLCAQYGNYRLIADQASMNDDLVQTNGFVLNRMAFGGSTEIDLVSPFLIVGVATGHYRWATGDEHGDATRSPFIVRPDEGMQIQLADSIVYGVSFDTASIDRTARLMYADDGVRLRFDSSIPVSFEHGRHLRDIVRLAIRDRQYAFESDLVAASLYRRTAACVVSTFPHSTAPVRRTENLRALLTGYRRASQFIDDFASLPITLDDIAEVAGLPVDQLQKAFRWHSTAGGTAEEALQHTRLDAAHHDLTAGEPGAGVTVRQIALRWGFTPGGLERAHRHVYGTSARAVLGG